MKCDILIEGISEPDLTEERIFFGLSPFFFHEQATFNPVQGMSLEEKVDKAVDVLVGTSRDIRKGPIPSEGIINSIKSNIRLSIEKHRPIDVVVAFGCAKTRALDQQGVDLAELMTIEQLALINQRVSQIYDQGIRYLVFLCDSWYLFLYGADDKAAVKKYCSEFELLINVLDLKGFQVQRLSNIVQSKGKDQIELKLKDNFELLKRYWEESEAHGEEEWGDLTSYGALCQAGWVGTIPGIQREFYKKKVKRYLPGAGPDEERDAVLRFFAYSLMIGQEDIFGRRISAADISFLSLPPGSPKQLHGNRLYWRSMPKGTSNKWPAPWTAKGFLLHGGGSFRPSVMGVQEYQAHEYNLLQNLTLRLTYENNQINMPLPIYSRPT